MQKVFKDGYDATMYVIGKGCHFSHTSKVPGYVKKGEWIVEEYEGRYGVGYRLYWHDPNWRSGSQRYCTYFIKGRR